MGPEADDPLIARTLRGFAVGLPFFSAFQLITRTFYATQDSRTPAIVNIGAAIVTVAVDVALVRAVGWDVPALALGHAAVVRVRDHLGLSLLRPKLGSLDGGASAARSRARAGGRGHGGRRVARRGRGGRGGRHADGDLAARTGRAAVVAGVGCVSARRRSCWAWKRSMK